VQRLFSTFPNSWPGLGLLILRCAFALSLLVAQSEPSSLSPYAFLLRGAAVLIAAFLVAGACTPVAALIAVVYEVLQILLEPAVYTMPLLFAAFGAAIAMLGPGAWSLDGVIFGRKRIDVGERGDKR
jgi:putative oxidoreductase